MSRKRSAQLDADIAEVLTKPISESSYLGGLRYKTEVYGPGGTRSIPPPVRIQDRWPIGTYVKGLRFAFAGHVGKVTGYNREQLKVRFLQPVKVGSQDVRVAEFDVDEIAPVTREQLAIDKLLQRFRTLDDQRKQASEELHEAAVEADRVRASEERVPYAQASDVAKSARRRAADQRWANAVRAEKAVTTKMRDLVIKIRALDPAQVPWGWQNTR